MCGLCGVSFVTKNDINKAEIFANKLDLKLFHRGPDAKGNFKTYIKSNNILFHRRLSILEISDKGSQPMLSNDKNLAICFNGEIYNHLEIRKKLDKEFNISWKGNSDTETLIESFSQLGIEKTINMIEGMYAFALLDINNEKLYLGRDLFGEKPLYFYRNKENLIFSSEVHNVDENFFTINQSAIFQFLHYNYIPNSNCIYNNWEKVNPGEVIVFDKNLKSKKIFDLKDCISKEINLSRNLSQNEAEKEFEEIFCKVINDILVADVNVGVFLSGGVDSSLVTYFSKKIKNDIKTFSIGIKNNKDYDESYQSEKIADFLQTDHETFYVENEEIIENLESSVLSFDEPFADSSNILSYILSKKVKNKIKVALTGDGADELFGGYNRHIYANYLEKICKIFGKNFVYSNYFKKIIKTFFPFSNFFLANLFAYPTNKGSKLESIINFKNENDLVDLLVSNRNEYDKLDFDYLNKKNLNKINFNLDKSIFKTIINCDINNYLTDDILVKTDRASMSNSLETRAPFLNKNIFKLSQTISNDIKVKNLKGKVFLRNILKKYFSEELISSKKKGFSYPIYEFFLSDQNQNWIQEIFLIKESKHLKLIPNEKLNLILKMHKKKQADYSNILWSNLVLRLWLKKKGFLS